ncbi:hypothetical protein HMPREF3188_01475 [Tissierellia bacterium KA00581]|jgi:hypothetical protein|nr:hypothetical protein HMPREF3188_01475 [Tissierellia bacterium KA00581]
MVFKNYRFKFFVLTLLFILSFIFSFSIGRYPVKFLDVVSVIVKKIFYSSNEISTNSTIILNIRVPRVLCAVLVGAGLSTSGALFQGLLKNPMVSPNILGTTQASAFGAALGILLGFNFFTITFLSFSFGIISIFLAYSTSKIFKADRILGLILIGIVISSLFSASTSFIKLVADTENQLPSITYWLMGSLSCVKMIDFKFIFFPILIGLIVSNLYKYEINIFTMGEDEAKTLGLNTEKVRFIIIFFASLITASCVCVTGVIGWIGLIIPHFARLIFGDDYRFVIPASGLLGATFLLVVDIFCRNITTSEVPVGIVTSFVGAPIFLYLIYKKGRNYDRG